MDETRAISRRRLLQGGAAAVTGLSVLRLAVPAHAFPGQPGGTVIPWVDQPAANPVPEVIVRQLEWERLDSYLTPPDQFFVIKHYNLPVLSERDWRLAISGLVAHPQTFTLADLKARARRDVTFTMECSGNTGLPFFTGGVGTARWGGTPLAPVLEEAGGVEAGIGGGVWGAGR